MVEQLDIQTIEPLKAVFEVIEANLKDVIQISHPVNDIPRGKDPKEMSRLCTSEKYLNEEYIARAPTHPGYECNVTELSRFLYFTLPPTISALFYNGISEIYPEGKSIRLSGSFLYKGPNAFMGWHTNNEAYCRRVYISYCPNAAGESFFRYRDISTKEIITVPDPKGWDVKTFIIPKKGEEPLWHCVHSDTERYSFGFRVFHL